MGYSLGGLIFKNSAELDDEEILALLKEENYRNVDRITMSEASEKSQRGIAVGRLNDMVVVLARDKPHSCHFEQDKLSKLDERLAGFSTRGDVLCFLMNSVSDTYAFSLFQNGSRVRAMSTTEGEDLSDWGEAEGYESKPRYNEDDIVDTIDRFMGASLGDLLEDREIEVYLYY
jgi:hypothetical protein